MSTYSLEQKFEIWNDTAGTRIEIGADRDALDLVEIRSYGADSKDKTGSILMTREEARLMLVALNRYLEENIKDN